MAHPHHTACEGMPRWLLATGLALFCMFGALDVAAVAATLLNG